MISSIPLRAAPLVLALACLPPAAAHATDAVQDPERLVRSTTAALQAAVRALPEHARDDSVRLQTLFERHVLPQVDIDLLSRLLLGRHHWQSATDAQRAAFGAEVAKLLARSYSTALAELADADVEYRPVEYRGDDRARVRTDVRIGGGMTMPVTYKLRFNGGRWWLYDLSLGGVSMVAMHERMFAARLRAVGLDRLIAQLEAMSRKS